MVGGAEAFTSSEIWRSGRVFVHQGEELPCRWRQLFVPQSHAVQRPANGTVGQWDVNECAFIQLIDNGQSRQHA